MAEETITRDELAEALDSGEFGLNSSFVGGRELAVSVFAYIAAHREPEYEPGAMYQDADGVNWEYQPPPSGHPKCCWLRPGSEAAWSTGTPRRPLRKLVPEVPQEPAPAAPPEGEPLVVPGWMYEDRIGQRLYRMPYQGGWLLLPEGTSVPDDCPVYPLRALVPEPSWLPEAVIRAVADLLTEYTEREKAEEATARVCKLIREGVRRG